MKAMYKLFEMGGGIKGMVASAMGGPASMSKMGGGAKGGKPTETKVISTAK